MLRVLYRRVQRKCPIATLHKNSKILVYLASQFLLSVRKFFSENHGEAKETRFPVYQRSRFQPGVLRNCSPTGLVKLFLHFSDSFSLVQDFYGIRYRLARLFETLPAFSKSVLDSAGLLQSSSRLFQPHPNLLKTLSDFIRTQWVTFSNLIRTL